MCNVFERLPTLRADENAVRSNGNLFYCNWRPRKGPEPSVVEAGLTKAVPSEGEQLK